MAAILGRAGAGAGASGGSLPRATGWRRRRNAVSIAAVTGTGPAAPQEGALERPAWSGETPLSRLVGALIAFKLLYSLMKLASREVIVRTAEKSNIPWRERTKKVLESDVYEVFERIRDPNLVYPDYYLSPFHAYDESNLSWLVQVVATRDRSGYPWVFSRREELIQRDAQLKMTIGDLEHDLEETKKKCSQLAAELKVRKSQQHRPYL